MFGSRKPKTVDPYNTMGTSPRKPAKTPREPVPIDDDLPGFRHVTRVSRAAARAIERDYPCNRRYDSATFAADQVRHMADRARARGDHAVARELSRAADEAAKYPDNEVAFLKFF